MYFAIALVTVSAILIVAVPISLIVGYRSGESTERDMWMSAVYDAQDKGINIVVLAGDDKFVLGIVDEDQYVLECPEYGDPTLVDWN